MKRLLIAVSFAVASITASAAEFNACYVGSQVVMHIAEARDAGQPLWAVKQAIATSPHAIPALTEVFETIADVLYANPGVSDIEAAGRFLRFCIRND